MRRWLVATMLLLACAGCRKAGVADAGTFAAPPLLNLGKDRRDLLFTFVDADGKLHDVDAADKVPAERRKQVLVRDLSKTADELKADQYVYVADLTREEDGAWPYSIVGRYSVEKSIREGDFAAVDEADDGGRGVIIYGTSWCGACAQARAWLTQHGIAFADKDVEKDPKAAAEMQRKMKRAGMPFGGVPVIDVGGELMLGFDQKKLARLLKGT